MRGLILAAGALMLSACALGPDYVRPDITTPGAFRMARAEGESIANLPWWQILRDGELQKLVRISQTCTKPSQASKNFKRGLRSPK